MNKKNNRYLSLIFIAVTFIIAFIGMPTISAATESTYTAVSTCYVRSGPSSSYSPVKDGTDNVLIRSGDDLTYVKGPVSGNLNGKTVSWYGIKIDYAAKEYSGYISDECLSIRTNSYSDDTTFEKYLTDQGFPESYKVYLRKLHALHPNWLFVADKTGLDWNASVTAESVVGQSAISYLYPSLFYKDSSNPNGIIVDGTSWYAPCYDAVGFYLDPRNFLNEQYIFMFESAVYNASQDNMVQSILNNSFMEGSFTEEGYTKTYANAFIDAAKASKVSSIDLASRSLQEMGTEKSAAASGTVAGYEGYYNFFNIGAYSGENNYLLGLARAKQEGWNSIQKAITGGAMFIAKSYVYNGKDTKYFQKFNVSSNRQTAPYTYQYMTNIMAPASETTTLYKSYKNNNKLNDAYTFKIPVYTSMTANAYKVTRVDTIGGKTEDNGDTTENETKPSTPVVSPATKVTNAGYSVSTGYLTKIAIGTDMSTLRSKISNEGATIATANNSGNSKTSGKIATGDIIEIDSNTRYQAVVYGDLDGDGKVGVIDLLYMKKSIIGNISLNSAYKEAADLNKNGKIDVIDLLLLKKQIIGEYTINQ